MLLPLYVNDRLVWACVEMPNTLDSGSRGPSSHCFVFLGKTLNSRSASLHLYIFISVSEFSEKPDEMSGGNQERLESHQGGLQLQLEELLDLST